MKKINQKGFTLTEILISVAIMGFIGVVSSTLMLNFMKSSRAIENILEEDVDDILAERIILKDLKRSSPSFNNVLLKDDKNLLFFDYVTDAGDKTDSSERVFRMVPGKEFMLLVTKEDSSAMIYSPASAYEVSPPTNDINLSSSLKFVSINKDNIVTKSTDSSGPIWVPGQLVLLESLSRFRAMTASGLDFSKPARSPVYVGRVSGAGATILGAVNLKGFLNLTHPLYPTETATSEDYFFRNIPPSGGAAPLIRIRGVEIVKYYLAKDRIKSNEYNLLRAVYDGSKFGEGQVYSTNVEAVTFTRKSANDALIYYTINRNEKSL